MDIINEMPNLPRKTVGMTLMITRLRIEIYVHALPLSPTHSCIYSSVHPSTHPSIYTSIYSLIHISISPSIHLYTHLYIHPFILPSTHLFIHPSTCTSIHLNIHYSSIYPLTHSSTHPSDQAFSQ